MRLFGQRIPLSVSLVFWFVVWEAVGRMGVSSIFPPLSRIVAAGLTILPTDKFIKAAEISLRSFAMGPR
jgi:ABC-type nitrate/sulfonate/bicarbonate transport system permease component